MVFVQLLVTVCAGCGGEPGLWYVTALLAAPLFLCPFGGGADLWPPQGWRFEFHRHLCFRVGHCVDYLTAMHVQMPVLLS